ncbi:circularly permuted type 2 ATP-grasp protein [Microbacterium sp. BK668]|uniref:circularly permuted type 2 ATP-grasp protein n=1 Tax=Microbacterium sp. BK668 TaxID=2512118 RepID=UPI001061EDA5|nr:circularly permuted type 2 ATP-grasp protein [Microbacterium sp. BK668]TDN91722.1 putative circularly permuted ATP-grasp superfamily protein [Microbacterium sp. BK668]
MTVLRDYATTLAQPTLPIGEPGGARYDEVVAPDGSLRPAWKGLAEVALGLTPEELKRVGSEISRFLADRGVTYVPRGSAAQPWQLDPVPLVMEAASWSRLEVGLAQRAELLNALLVDLYGEQRVLRERIVPSAAVFGHAGYLRPLVRPSAHDPQPLLLSATDLGRDAEGEWHVLADRVQAPSGLGYAMENRRVLAQVMPDLYQESDLHRMEPYFAALRSALLNAAPDGVGDPRVVVLSPGTHSETAYDQAFLASTLGFPLVQASDLTVRGGWIWIKPPGWPKNGPTERVDVILRRVDADWCDPLELRGNSRLGVAGLTEAVRRGRVRVVNGLGAGVLENPALLPFMPAVCDALLGEQLRLPGVPTWWGGDSDGLGVLLDRLGSSDDEFVVRSIDESRRAHAGVEAAELRAQILAAPYRFVGQERLPLSQAPVWSSGRADAHPVVMRAFTVRYRQAFRPLLGGLATVMTAASASPVTKDVWVVKGAPDDPDQGLVDVAPLDFRPSIPALAPRALEDMFWAGRYAERAEDLLRILLTADAHLEELTAPVESEQGIPARALLNVLQRLAGRRSADPEEEFRSLLLDGDRRGSAAQALDRLRDALEGVRDQMSADTWRVFAHTDRAERALRTSERAHRITESAGRLLTAVLSLHGVTASMIRDPGWHMIEAGRYLERGLQLCTLLGATTTDRHGTKADRDVLEAVLTAAESSVTFRRRYRGNVRTSGVLELLLVDRDNPRSLAFAFRELRAHLAAMPASTGSTRPERLLEHLETALENLDLAALATPSGSRRPRLQRYFDSTRTQLMQLADSVGDVHFASGPEPQTLSTMSVIEVQARRP